MQRPRLHERTCTVRTFAIVSVLAIGCADLESAVDYGEAASAVTVATYTTSGCSTSVVLGLSKQIADEVGCIDPAGLVKLEPGGNLTFTSNAVLPYLSAPARTALANVTASSTIQINSGFRTVAQQYLLYRWKQQGRCGIRAAATPGRSNHQSGRALDLANYSSRITAMKNQGWTHYGAGDPVHFDHLASPDIRGRDVLAFQRLWNRNNPGDEISEDGAYGPQTEARLRQTPATGFPVGATCADRALISSGADVVSIDGPDRIAPGSHATYTIILDNLGVTDWPASTRLVVAGGATSTLYDAASWTSPGVIGPIGQAIPAGARGTIDLEVVAPMVTVETPVFTQLQLTDGGVMLGALHLAVTVTPNGDEGTSSEGEDDVHDDDDAPGGYGDAEVTGGCAAGGGATGAVLLLPALALVRRRRRR